MTQATLESMCRQHDVWVHGDSTFQRRARLLQALWREERGLPIGSHKGAPLGSRLAMPQAEQELWNFLTPGVGQLVRAEFEHNQRVRSRIQRKVYGYPRLFDDLLSSQPMCFNLFGELALDFALATKVLAPLWPQVVGTVKRIEFEYSPGRQDTRYLANGTAADVFIECLTPHGDPSFIAVETKYHENLRAAKPEWKPRYAEVATSSQAFTLAHEEMWKAYCQIWLDHLLALSMVATDGWSRGLFVLAYPAENVPCATAATAYAKALSAHGTATFAAVTLEKLHGSIDAACDADWAAEFAGRYLDFNRVDRAVRDAS